jgi:hypothetical protein
MFNSIALFLKSFKTIAKKKRARSVSFAGTPPEVTEKRARRAGR